MYSTIRRLVLLIGQLFYPQVVLIGHVPDGPLVLAGNHPNGLLDGLVLLLAIKRPLAFLAKSTFFANPLLALGLRAFGAVPVYRPADVGKLGGPPLAHGAANTATFAAAHTLLRNGGILAVFPEGTPNPSPALLPLKTGVARIGLGAEAEAGWAMGLRVVPVGLWFEEQTRAGTAALVVLGEPIVVADLRAEYEQQPEDAVRAFTTQLQYALAGAVGAAQQLGQAHELAKRATRASWRGVGWAQQAAWVVLLALGALPAFVGYIMALPGRAIAWVLMQVLARRHRATVGTARLVALLAGLVLGWGSAGVAVGLVGGWRWGLVALLAGPLCGYIGLRLRLETLQRT